MAEIVVEDGSGVDGADSYASVEQADSYCADFGYTIWPELDNDAKSVALRQGTRYVDQNYSYVGCKTDPDNPLEWPRKDAYLNGQLIPEDSIPLRIINATIEAARISSEGNDLYPALSRGGLVKREKVDVLEVEYMDGAPSGNTYTILDSMVKPLLTVLQSLTSNIQLVRA